MVSIWLEPEQSLGLFIQRERLKVLSSHCSTFSQICRDFFDEADWVSGGMCGCVCVNEQGTGRGQV